MTRNRTLSRVSAGYVFLSNFLQPFLNFCINVHEAFIKPEASLVLADTLAFV